MPSGSANGPAAYRRQERFTGKRAYQGDGVTLLEMSYGPNTEKYINIYHAKRQVRAPHFARGSLAAAAARATRQKRQHGVRVRRCASRQPYSMWSLSGS